MATTVGPTLDLPVTIRVGEGEPVEIGRLDVTIGIAFAPGERHGGAVDLLCTVTPADGATVNARLADLLDQAAAQLRADSGRDDPAREVLDAAPR